MNKNRPFMGSMSRVMWVRDQIRLKRFGRLSDLEKLLLFALADCPARAEYLVDEYDLEQEATEGALERLSLAGFIYYQDGRDYVYAVLIPEDEA